jgi:hypothetical protein
MNLFFTTSVDETAGTFIGIAEENGQLVLLMGREKDRVSLSRPLSESERNRLVEILDTNCCDGPDSCPRCG